MKKKPLIQIPPDILDRAGKRSRPPAILIQQRNSEVVDMLLACKPRQVIHKFLREKYHIGYQACNDIMINCYKIIREEYIIDKETVINQHIQKYYDIVDKNEDLDPRVQIQAMNAIEKLLNMLKPETVINNNKLEINLKDLTINELKELLSQ